MRQLVQLVSLDLTFNSKNHSHQICYDLGKSLSQDTHFASQIQQHDRSRERSQKLYKNKQGAMLFLHMSKNGGTTMCALARANKLITPRDEGSLSLFSSVMGKNCNPASFQMDAWFGSRQQQLDYIRKFGIQFYANEKHLSRPEDVPFGDVMLVTTLRHPIGRLYSLYRRDGTRKYTKMITKEKMKRGEMTADLVLARWYDSKGAKSVSRNLRDLIVKSSKARKQNEEWKKRLEADNSFLKKHYKQQKPVVSRSDTKMQLSQNNSTVGSSGLKKLRMRNTFENYLIHQADNGDLNYFMSMRFEPSFHKNYVFCRKSNVEYRSNPCNMTLFRLQRDYDNSDFALSSSMLNKFNYVIIFEIMDLMVPMFAKKILEWKQYDVNHHRLGTRGVADDGITVIAAYPELIDLAVMTADYSLDLYKHGTRLGCYHYYRILSRLYVSPDEVRSDKASISPYYLLLRLLLLLIAVTVTVPLLTAKFLLFLRCCRSRLVPVATY